MNGLPLHPAIVHLPLALALLMPLIAAGLAWALWTGRLSLRAWTIVVAVQALLLGGGLVAMNTGESDEERVEAVVSESLLHRHEEAAEQFVWAAGLTLALSALVLLAGRRRPVANALALSVVTATLVVAGLGLRVGHAGGQLVYVHGAASAYASAASAAPSGPPVPGARHDDDDDR